jgi:hypothetical protein
MAATEKTDVVRARMTPEEVLMLKALAGKDETMSDVLRDLLRREYRRRFGDARPGLSTTPTLRGIIHDLTGPISFTAGDLATRAGLPLRGVVTVLEALAKWRMIERVDGEGSESTWESLLIGGARRLLREAATAGFSLDLDLREMPIKDWMPVRPVRAWGLKPDDKVHARNAVAWAKGWTTPAPLMVQRIGAHDEAVEFRVLDPQGRPLRPKSLYAVGAGIEKMQEALSNEWVALEGIDEPWAQVRQRLDADGYLAMVLRPVTPEVQPGTKGGE